MAMDVYKYVVMGLGLSLLLEAAGIETGTKALMGKLGFDALIKNPGILMTAGLGLKAAIALAAVGTGIIISFFTKSAPESYLLIAYTSLLLTYVWDITSIMIYAAANYGGWISALIFLILLPLNVGYIHSVVSWWGGKG